MATGTVSRLAGKALGDFLKFGLAATGSIAEQSVLNLMRGARTPGEILSPNFQKQPQQPQPSPSQRLAGYSAIPEQPAPELPRGAKTLASVARVAAPVTVAAGALGLSTLAQKMAQRSQNVYAQSGYSLPVQKMGTPVSFANQQYVGGVSPMTNQAAAEAMLEQQKFQHQLQLIEARQAAATRQGSLQPVPQQELSSLSNLLSRTYTY